MTQIPKPTPPAVTLRPATLADAETVWRWMAQSDLTADMMGPPHFPNQPAPTLADYLADFEPHYFTGEAPHQGRTYLIEQGGEIWGQITYNALVPHPHGLATELDIWLRAREATGRGLGAAAIGLLCDLLRTDLGVALAFIRPAARNTRAIRAYAKAGFAPVEWDPAETQALFGPDDYDPGCSHYMARML